MGTTCLKVRITHPFHPLCGRTIEVVCRRRYWGEDRIVYVDDNGRPRFIAAVWTDVDPVDPFRRVAAGRAPFRTADLLALCQVLDRLAEEMGSRDA
jgi:hypothetical protein